MKKLIFLVCIVLALLVSACTSVSGGRSVSPSSPPSPVPPSSEGEQAALERAIAFIEHVEGLSRASLYDQLLYEGYSESEAAFAVDNCGAVWMKEAAKAAAGYHEFGFDYSEKDMIAQLEEDGYTHEEAVYGATHWKKK